MLRLTCVSLLLTCAFAAVEKAIVKIDGTEGVSGNVTFTQTGNGILVEGLLKGLTPGSHGFHVHNLGDITNGCGSTGPHFNPFNKVHGAPNAKERHVGDLGNIEADQSGNAIIKITDNQISLQGETCIIGRAVVVHSGVDDLGLGGNEESKKTGNAGTRVACGVIGIFSELESASVALSSFSLLGLLGIALANFVI